MASDVGMEDMARELGALGLVEQLHEQLGIPWTIATVVRGTIHDEMPISMVFVDGTSIRWPKQKDLENPKALWRPFLLRGIEQPKDFRKTAGSIAAAIFRLANAEVVRIEVEEAISWGRTFLERLAVVEADVENHLWESIREFRRETGRSDDDPFALDHAPYMRCTTSGDAYVRRDLFHQWVRHTYSKTLDAAEIYGRMEEAGWERRRLQCWPPGVKHSDRQPGTYMNVHVYRVPEGWEHLL
jgi:hypothetical protein